MTPPSFRRLRRAAGWLGLAALLIAGATIAVVSSSAWRSSPTTILLTCLATVSALVLAWRASLVARYRPVPPPDDDDLLPHLTVVVPAFNEGRQVYDTVASIVASDYPHARVQLIAIDDGSSDDTWRWIERARRDFGIEAIRSSANRGKRHALYAGFGRARGDVIVTVDSDSEVRPDTLRHLVAPIVADPEVGGVAGTVRVLHRRQMIPRMLDVTYTHSFELVRASESVLGAVVCCPGALSAYRRSIIDAVKEEWVSRRVFGRPANIGEDRALTNHTLRRGYQVVLQNTAVVLTDAPTTYPQLWRMLLRWARSNVRETVVLGGFVFSRFRRGSMLGIRILFVHHALTMAITGLLFVPTLVALVLHPGLLLAAAIAALVAATVPFGVYMLCRRPSGAIWAFPYSLLSTFGLIWITPLALITPHRTGWLTRGQPTPSPSSVPSAVTPRVTT